MSCDGGIQQQLLCKVEVAHCHIKTLCLLCALTSAMSFSQTPFVIRPHDDLQLQPDVCVSFRSRQLELEDKQSILELELRKYMELDGVYFGVLLK